MHWKIRSVEKSNSTEFNRSEIPKPMIRKLLRKLLRHATGKKYRDKGAIELVEQLIVEVVHINSV